jgi:UDP-N-acetylmuramyl pentapeptide phosphotransferase/UDP-N-acetylglucosamine-1-phosphate transferase
MLVLEAFLVGLVLGLGTWWLTRPVLATEALQRTNYRDAVIPTGGGIVIVIVVVVAEGVALLADANGWELDAATVAPRRMVTTAVLGLGFLGLLDDLAGTGQSGGFRGHLAQLAKGHLTTGSLKLFGGGAVGVLAVAGPRSGSIGRILLDAALVALAANLGNLLDRAPGRTLKVALFGFLVLVVTTLAPPELAPVAVTMGAAAALLWPDLRERLMLGDVGANVVGGVLGLGLVLVTAPEVRTVALVAVALLNLVSERISFSRVIDATPPLRALDRAGRIPQQ